MKNSQRNRIGTFVYLTQVKAVLFTIISALGSYSQQIKPDSNPNTEDHIFEFLRATETCPWSLSEHLVCKTIISDRN